MYRKRKRSGAVDVDVEVIAAQVRQEVTAQVTQEVTAKVTKEVTSKVTQDVMSYLVDQGLLVRPPSSRTPSPACGRRSSCASASNAVPNDLELGPSSVAPDTIDLLEEPTQCSLVVNLGNYRPVVAEGRVFPKEFVLESVQIDYDYAIVKWNVYIRVMRIMCCSHPLMMISKHLEKLYYRGYSGEGIGF